MPKNPEIKKVLMIGSGPIVIGQAAEFDYAGNPGLPFLGRKRASRSYFKLQSGYHHDG